MLKKKLYLSVVMMLFCVVTWAQSSVVAPVTEKPTVVNGEPGYAYESFDRLVDGDTNTKYCMAKSNDHAPWVEFYYSRPIIPQGYVLWTANDTDGKRNPRTWRILAKIDADDEWTVLTSVDNSNEDQLPMANYASKEFTIDNNAAYRYFRFEATFPTDYDSFQLAELQMKEALGVLAGQTIYDGGEEPSKFEEGSYCLLDGYLDTKYCLGGSDPWVEFHYEKPITPLGYLLWTANDTGSHSDRNPASWTIKGKNEDDADWTVLSTVDNSNGDKLPKADFASATFLLDGNKSYQYFRFEATLAGKEFQLSELQFLINPFDLSRAFVDGLDDTYPDCYGQEVPISFTVTDRAGTTLTAGTHYEVIIRNSSGQTVNAATVAGSYTLTIKGIGLYSGEQTLDFSVEETVNLAADADNTNVIHANANQAHYVRLEGCTLYKDGRWNTLTLPFNYYDLQGTPFEGATVKQLLSSTFENGTLTLEFSVNLNYIEAGKPFFVKWTTPEPSVSDPVFRVLLTEGTGTVETDYADFVGNTSPVGFKRADNTVLVFNADNELRWVNAPMTVSSMQSLFRLKNGLKAGKGNNVTSYVMNFVNETISGTMSGYTTLENEIPLTLEAVSKGTVTFTNNAAGAVTYKVDDGAAQTIAAGAAANIALTAGQQVAFYGDNATYYTNSKNSLISCSADCYVYGNVMSLVSSTDYDMATQLTAANTFLGLFSGNTHIKNHPDHKLQLPATTLTQGCYQNMFAGCTSLTESPLLVADKLANNCYDSMFSGCSQLSSVTCRATDLSAAGCTNNWLKGVAATGTFYKLPGTSYSTGDSGIPKGWTVVEDAKALPLTLEAIADGTVTINNKADGPVTCKISSGEVKTVESGTEASITLTAGQKVCFFGDNDTYYTNKISTINCTADCYIYGNIMSLINSKDYPTATELTRENTFRYLFSNNTHIKNHPSKELLLPATTLTENCYQNMFQDCTALTEAPALPATKMEEACYMGMFYKCTSLTKAPDLPATEMKEWCYNAMFWGCTSLTEAPDLPATKMDWSCYDSMFMRCTSLTKAPVLPAKKLEQQCYFQMFDGCEKLSSVTCLATDISAKSCTFAWLRGVAAKGTFIKDAETVWPTGVDGIPEGWTEKLDGNDGPLMLEAIADATVTFTNNSYGTVNYQVSGDEVKTIQISHEVEIIVKAGQQVWFKGDNKTYISSVIQCDADCYVYGNVMSLTNSKDYKTATELTEARTFCCLFSCNTHIKNHPVYKLKLPATKLTPLCYNSMFEGCTGLTEAPELPATTLADGCYESMFLGCTSMTKAPELTVTTLVDNCYKNMFRDCEKLSSVTCLATDITVNGCTSGWLKGVADKGTFTKAAGMKSWTTGADGIPEGWTVTDMLQSDVNGDGVVDIADAIAIMNYLVGKSDSTFNEANADVNGDGTVDIADAVKIVNLVTGNITEL